MDRQRELAQEAVAAARPGWHWFWDAWWGVRHNTCLATAGNLLIYSMPPAIALMVAVACSGPTEPYAGLLSALSALLLLAYFSLRRLQAASLAEDEAHFRRRLHCNLHCIGLMNHAIRRQLVRFSLSQLMTWLELPFTLIWVAVAWWLMPVFGMAQLLLLVLVAGLQLFARPWVRRALQRLLPLLVVLALVVYSQRMITAGSLQLGEFIGLMILQAFQLDALARLDDARRALRRCRRLLHTGERLEAKRFQAGA